MSLFGILNVNKPPGLTSRDAVNRVERLVRPAKAGHAGTLDPLATGVLVVCVGQATRLIQHVQRMPKTYEATFLLGRSSDTEDLEGDVILRDDVPEPSRDALEAVLPQFHGEIQQRPPAHSAIRVDGKRAYALARRGVVVDLPARPVTIHSLTVRRYEYPELELNIVCGSGTYVRSLGRDIGTALGTAAVMSKLERTAIGPFRVADAISPDNLTIDLLAERLQPAVTALGEMPRVQLSAAQLLEIHNGRPILMEWLAAHSAIKSTAELAAVDTEGRLVGLLYEKRPGELWPSQNFKS